MYAERVARLEGHTRRTEPHPQAQAAAPALSPDGQRGERAPFRVLTQGEGPIPARTDRVRVHYTGKLIDGTVFDSSVARGEPAEFPVTGVIGGWIEALTLMPVGSKWELTIPHNLAYGERGAGASIPPFSTLIFEVELLDII